MRLPLWLRRRLPGYRPPPERWAHMELPYTGDDVVVVDCETSEFDKKKGQLLSLAAVVVSGRSIELS